MKAAVQPTSSWPAWAKDAMEDSRKKFDALKDYGTNAGIYGIKEATAKTVQVAGRDVVVIGFDPARNPGHVPKVVQTIEEAVKLFQGIAANKGTPNKIDDAYSVGIKFAFLKQFVAYTFWHLSENGVDSLIKAGGDKGFIDTNNIVTIVKELTAKHKCRFVELPGIPADAIGNPTHFVSHRWGQAWTEFFGQLEGERMFRQYKNSPDGRGKHSFRGADIRGPVYDYSEDEYYWVDVFCLNQHDDKSTDTNTSELVKLLPECLLNCKMVIVCMDTEATLFKGLWCMYELWQLQTVYQSMSDNCCGFGLAGGMLLSCGLATLFSSYANAMAKQSFGNRTILALPLPLLSFGTSATAGSNFGTDKDRDAIRARYNHLMYTFDFGQLLVEYASRRGKSKQELLAVGQFPLSPGELELLDFFDKDRRVNVQSNSAQHYAYDVNLYVRKCIWEYVCPNGPPGSYAEKFQENSKIMPCDADMYNYYVDLVKLKAVVTRKELKE